MSKRMEARVGIGLGRFVEPIQVAENNSRSGRRFLRVRGFIVQKAVHGASIVFDD
jgi:hypothetical protein